MMHHLDSAKEGHREAYAAEVAKKAGRSGSGKPGASSTEDQRSMEQHLKPLGSWSEKLSCLIAETNPPLSVAEDMYFEYLLLAQEGKATVPTRRAPLADLRMSKMV